MPTRSSYRSNATVLGLTYLLIALVNGKCPLGEAGEIKLTDVSSDSGVDFVHDDGGCGERYIVEYVSGGLAIFDFDGDGLEDLYLLNGGNLSNATDAPRRQNRLYRNLGDLKFRDVTTAAGVGDVGHSLGVAVADFDNDGDQDLYVNNFGPNRFFVNQGDGTFVSHDEPLLQCERGVGAGVVWLDIEQDGDLDLFVANYVDFSFDNHPQREYRGRKTYPSPQDFEPQTDRLFRNEGNGQFVDVTQSSGIGTVSGTGMGCIAFDYDADGDDDIFVCNDVMENFIYENNGQGVFTEVGVLAGVALDFAGVRQGSMGVDSGDVDRDGRTDLLVTNYQDETPVLYRNAGEGFFDDVTVNVGELSQATPDVTWGVGLVDLDNDGWLDLFMASGHLMDNIGQTDDTQTYAARNLVFQNDGAGGFTNVSEQAGPGLEVEAVSRGAGFADLDNDGDLDVVVLNSNARPTLLRNDSEQSGNWIQIEVRASTGNRDAVGCVVELEVGGLVLRRRKHAGRGYQSHFGSRLHFGLGKADQIKRIRVLEAGKMKILATEMSINVRTSAHVRL